MSARPRLIRSIPFWILIAGSLATIGFGLWLTTDKLGVMSATLADGTATGVEVYVGQVWAIVGGILIATGLIGLALSLVLGVVRSLIPVPAVEVVEAITWSDDIADDDEIIAEQPAASDVRPTEPVLGTPVDEPADAQPAEHEPVTTEPGTSPQR